MTALDTNSRQIDRSPRIPDRVIAERHVLDCYRTLLKREPGSAEKDQWISAMLAGMPADAIYAAFERSDEHRALQRHVELTERIAATGLFEPSWYAVQNPDVVAASIDPFVHYCRFGRLEGRSPNAFFLPRWYAQRCELPTDTDPLLDYAERGEALGLQPSPDFDPGWYRAVYDVGPGLSPLAHFLRHNGVRGFAPSPRLWSLAFREPGAETGNRFLTWLAPPDPFAAAAPDVSTLVDTGLFDANHYQIVNNDVFESEVDPLVHYCAFGWREGRNPSFYFNAEWYLATNPDLQRLGVNPLVHYLLIGEPAGRRPVVWFDPAWYRRTYGIPDGVSALGHYLSNRHSGRFSPNSLFDPEWYRAHCGQKLHPRRDAFAHFLVAGMQSDLQPSAQFDAAAWRRRTRGRRSRHFRLPLTPERDNPLVDYMLTQYR